MSDDTDTDDDPAGDLVDSVEDANVQLADDQDPEEIREFIEAAERGDFGDIDPGLKAQIQMARSVLEDTDDE